MTLLERLQKIGVVKHQWGPQRSDNLALISLDESPFKAVWPVRILQLFGGERWTFGVVIFTNGPKIQSQRKFKKLPNYNSRTPPGDE